MDITCDCSQDWYDYPELYREDFPIAKKPHKCCECGENIKPGQKYHKAIGKWNGEFKTFYTCMTCYRIRDAYCSNGFIFGGLAEAIKECLGVDYRKAE